MGKSIPGIPAGVGVNAGVAVRGTGVRVGRGVVVGVGVRVGPNGCPGPQAVSNSNIQANKINFCLHIGFLQTEQTTRIRLDMDSRYCRQTIRVTRSNPAINSGRCFVFIIIAFETPEFNIVSSQIERV